MLRRRALVGSGESACSFVRTANVAELFVITAVSATFLSGLAAARPFRGGLDLLLTVRSSAMPKGPRLFLSTALATALIAFAPAAAQDDPWTIELDLATDYVSKGRSRSQGDPHAGVTIERAFGAFTVGAWAGSINATNGSDAQTNVYVGAEREFAGWDLGAQVAHKRRWNMTPDSEDWTYETTLSATRTAGPNRFRLRLQGTPNNYGPTKQSYFLEGGYRRRLNESWFASTALARREQTDAPDYTTWNVGATVEVAPDIDLDLRWYDTNREDLDASFDGRAVAAVTFAF
jgi:uncharacterized protein (TIGR02001 family)